MGVYKSTQLTASTDYTTNIVPAFGYKYYKAEYNQPLIISETNVDYQAGTTVTILVDINYINPDYPNQAKGFTLSTYSRRSLTILNEFNANFQQHMDGQTPSGFMNAPAVASADITPNGGQFDFGQIYTGATAANIVVPVVTPTTAVSTDKKVSDTIAIKSLVDCMYQARDSKMFFDLVNANPWVLVIWFSLW